MDDTLVLTPSTNMIEMMYFAKFNSDAGVMFTLDGLH